MGIKRLRVVTIVSGLWIISILVIFVIFPSPFVEPTDSRDSGDYGLLSIDQTTCEFLVPGYPKNVISGPEVKINGVPKRIKPFFSAQIFARQFDSVNLVPKKSQLGKEFVTGKTSVFNEEVYVNNKPLSEAGRKVIILKCKSFL